MMSLESENIQHLLEEALKALAESKGAELVHQIKPILLANLDRGRYQNSREGNPDPISAYVWLVSENFVKLNPYLHQLQVERSHAAWEPLFERMQTWAYNFLLRKSFVADDHTREIAIECASDAAVFLLNAHFPYDTKFEPWAHIIVQNACRKYMQKALKKSVIPEDKKVELEDNLTDPNDPPLEISALRKESGIELASTLKQLSEARRTVIQFIYLDDMKPEDVAQKMGKSIGAIYSLQFNALQDLRKILGANKDNLNE